MKKKFGIYHFKVTLAGGGTSPEEAWNDAVEGFCQDPGCTPEKDEYEFEEEVED